jgi:hypothetical protein
MIRPPTRRIAARKCCLKFSAWLSTRTFAVGRMVHSSRAAGEPAHICGFSRNGPIVEKGETIVALSLYQASVPVFEEYLMALAAILEKAEAYAATKKIDSAVIGSARLALDMFPLARQVQLACDFAKNAGARLTGTEPPTFENTETNLKELRDRITRTLAFIQAKEPAKIDAMFDQYLQFPLGSNRAKMLAQNYLLHFALPNFFFHVTAAYAILRHYGLDIGKRDFLGNVRGLDVV